MSQVAALSILALTVGLSLVRPCVGQIRIHPPLAALLGATLTVSAGLVPLAGVSEALRFLLLPLLTIVSLMMLTLIAEEAGIFRVLAWRVGCAGGGVARRLFTYLFLLGTVFGALFTNDAAVLILTPLIYRLVEEIKDDSWQERHRLPYYFAALYVANLVGIFVTSNPINIIVADWFGIGFVEYVTWMFLPAIVSVVVTLVGMLIFFRNAMPHSYRLPPAFQLDVIQRRLMKPTVAVLSLTLLGFFAEPLTSLPTSYVAAVGAATLTAVYWKLANRPLMPFVRRIGWDALIFVTAIFVVAHGLRNAGLTGRLGTLILHSGASFEQADVFATGFIAGISSALMNNHPVAGTMAMVIGDLPVPDVQRRLLAFAALIGGDLGPKMLPIGSLAALLWLRLLRAKGIEISYWQYVKLGVPVTLAAILLATLTLWLEFQFGARVF